MDFSLAVIRMVAVDAPSPLASGRVVEVHLIQTAASIMVILYRTGLYATNTNPEAHAAIASILPIAHRHPTKGKNPGHRPDAATVSALPHAHILMWSCLYSLHLNDKGKGDGWPT